MCAKGSLGANFERELWDDAAIVAAATGGPPRLWLEFLLNVGSGYHMLPRADPLPQKRLRRSLLLRRQETMKRLCNALDPVLQLLVTDRPQAGLYLETVIGRRGRRGTNEEGRD